jgi:transposase
VCGIDVSAKTLVGRRWRNGTEQNRTFDNTADGHGEIARWMGAGSRVCVEATGVYHLQLCLTLTQSGVEVMVVNPRAAKDFARAMQNRSKTDAVDAGVLLEYARRMEFVPWQPPSSAVFELRELGRRMRELTQTGVREKNRLHARRVSAISRTVAADIEDHVAEIEARVKKIEKRAA